MYTFKYLGSVLTKNGKYDTEKLNRTNSLFCLTEKCKQIGHIRRIRKSQNFCDTFWGKKAWKMWHTRDILRETRVTYRKSLCEWMIERKRDSKKTTNCKSYKKQDVVESHNGIRPERRRYIEKKIKKRIWAKMGSLMLVLYLNWIYLLLNAVF